VSRQIVSLIVMVVIFAGALAGMRLRSVLPEHHLNNESRDVIKLGIGLVGTMAAMVLGLLVASAKSSFDAQTAQLIQMSANVMVLDRILAHYGPETKEIRESMREAVLAFQDQTWSKTRRGQSHLQPGAASNELLYGQIQDLSPKNEQQRALQAQALTMAMNVRQMRSIMYEQATASVSLPLLVVMVFWLTVIFLSWGLLAPPNGTLLVTMFISALSVSGAIFLILEMYSPYSGWIQVSQAPIRAALAHLGQ
jgi:Protein of unknown function (DUF4239)